MSATTSAAGSGGGFSGRLRRAAAVSVLAAATVAGVAAPAAAFEICDCEGPDRGLTDERLEGLQDLLVGVQYSLVNTTDGLLLNVDGVEGESEKFDTIAGVISERLGSGLFLKFR